MRASARIVAAVGASGETVLAQLRGEAPLLPRATGPRGRVGNGVSAWRGGAAQVHLVGGAAGPLGGDDLHLHVEVGPGASLVLRSVAATVALPGPGAEASVLSVTIRVADGGRLAYLPEPTVAAAGCDHRMVSTVELEAGARLAWREEFVAGRHGEAPGRLRQELRVRYGGRTVLAQELDLTRDAWGSPAVLAGHRTAGTWLFVDPTEVDRAGVGPTEVGRAEVSRAEVSRAEVSRTEVGRADVSRAEVGPTEVGRAEVSPGEKAWTATATVHSARMPLGGPAVLLCAVAPDLPTLRRRLGELSPAGC